MRRVFDRLLRHVVRWLRRHRYARMAGRIRELEIELGMVDAAGRVAGWYRYSHGTVFGAQEHWRRNERPCRGCMQAYIDNTLHRTPDEAATERLMLFADHRVREHVPYPTALHEWTGEKQCPQCVRMLDIARVTARTSE